jgi:hypothetical protein
LGEAGTDRPLNMDGARAGLSGALLLLSVRVLYVLSVLLFVLDLYSLLIVVFKTFPRDGFFMCVSLPSFFPSFAFFLSLELTVLPVSFPATLMSFFASGEDADMEGRLEAGWGVDREEDVGCGLGICVFASSCSLLPMGVLCGMNVNLALSSSRSYSLESFTVFLLSEMDPRTDEDLGCTSSILVCRIRVPESSKDNSVC